VVRERPDALLLQVDSEPDLSVALRLSSLQPRLQGRHLHPRVTPMVRHLTLSHQRGGVSLVHGSARLYAGPRSIHAVQHRG
jgi:hypothetical protein